MKRIFSRDATVAPARWLFVLGLWLAPPGAFASGSSTNGAAQAERGFTYIHEEIADKPWSIHVVKISRAQTNLELHTTLGLGASMGMGLVSEQVKALPAELGRPVAAVNGDFYRNHRNNPGDPEGLQITGGEIVSGPSPTRVCLWLDADGRPHRGIVTAQFSVKWPDGTSTAFGLNEKCAADAAVLYTPAKGPSTRAQGGVELVLERAGENAWLPLRPGQTLRARVRQVRQAGDTPLPREGMVLSLGSGLASRIPQVTTGAVLVLSTATTPDLAGAMTAIGGGPTLVATNKATQWTDFQPRHPRTAVGWNNDYIYLVEVDGRQSRLSIGMTLPELAAYMIKLGCEEALNLDGGGSATMWVYGNVMNSPSEGKERDAANALVLIDRAKGRTESVAGQPR